MAQFTKLKEIKAGNKLLNFSKGFVSDEDKGKVEKDFQHSKSLIHYFR